MGLWNTFESAETCPRCGSACKIYCEYKAYGAIYNYFYSLGDKILPAAPRDRKLRYLELGPSSCENCKSEHELKILVIRGDVCESIRTVPAAASCVRGHFKDYEVMLLAREHPSDRIVEANRRAWACHRSRDFSGLALTPQQEMVRKAFRGVLSRAPEWLNALPKNEREEVERKILGGTEPDEYLATVSIDREAYRATILAELSTPPYFKPEKTSNFIAHDVRCAGCSKARSALIPFAYGPVNGYEYRLGETIDWSIPGRLMDVRDRELRYVDVSVPECDACGHAGRGMITVENDVIADVFVWPKEILALIDAPDIPSWERGSKLDHFLNVREFGADVYRLSLEERNDALRRDAREPNAIYAGLMKGAPEDVRDHEAIHRFYDYLKKNYRRVRGADYAG